MGVQYMKKTLKLLSNRAMFKQLLARDILAILAELNANTWCDIVTLRQHLENKQSARFYLNNCTAEGHSFTGFDDRFYRAIQGINDKGYGITVRKDKQTNKLFVFNTNFADNYVESIADMFENWNADYNRNNGYKINAQLDEVA